MHDLHNNYPLAGEKIRVTKEMLSEYQLQVIEDNHFALGRNKKFILRQGNKKKIQTPLSKLNTLFKFRVTIKKNS